MMKPAQYSNLYGFWLWVCLFAATLFAAPVSSRAETVNPPVLLQPGNGDTLFNLHPVFTWTPSAGANAASYMVYMVEMQPFQTPTAALLANPVWYGSSWSPITVLTYPINAPQLQAGKSYAWQVLVQGSEGQPNIASEPGYFVIPPPPPAPPPPVRLPVVYAHPLEQAQPDVYQVIEDTLYFIADCEKQTDSVCYAIFDREQICRLYSQNYSQATENQTGTQRELLINYGKNYLALSVKNQLERGAYYRMNVLDGAKRVKYLKFYYPTAAEEAQRKERQKAFDELRNRLNSRN